MSNVSVSVSRRKRRLLSKTSTTIRPRYGPSMSDASALKSLLRTLARGAEREDASFIKPFAVKLRPDGRRLLGDKCYSEIYEEIAKGRLELIKDGRRSLLTMRSIEAYMASLPPAEVKKYPPK